MAISASAYADDSPLLKLGLGYFNVSRSNDNAAEVRVEYQARKTYAGFIKPIFGASAISSGSAYVFAGIAADIKVGDNFAITPSFAPGLYAHGGGLDLGHAIEFRSQLELSYILEDSSRVSLAISHRSNGGIGDRNPGEETASLYYSMPFHGLADW